MHQMNRCMNDQRTKGSLFTSTSNQPIAFGAWVSDTKLGVGGRWHYSNLSGSLVLSCSVARVQIARGSSKVYQKLLLPYFTYIICIYICIHTCIHTHTHAYTVYVMYNGGRGVFTRHRNIRSLITACPFDTNHNPCLPPAFHTALLISFFFFFFTVEL